MILALHLPLLQYSLQSAEMYYTWHFDNDYKPLIVPIDFRSCKEQVPRRYGVWLVTKTMVVWYKDRG